MLKKKLNARKGFTPLEVRHQFLTGFTLTELMVSSTIFAIMTIAVGVALTDSQHGWHKMYNRVYSEVVSDSYVASKMFEAMVRRASRERILLDEEGNWVEVYYYSNSDSPIVDRYMRFYESDGTLSVEYGQLNPREVFNTQIISENVSECGFKGAGRSAQMMLTLDDGSQAVTVVCSAVMHNQ